MLQRGLEAELRVIRRGVRGTTGNHRAVAEESGVPALHWRAIERQKLVLRQIAQDAGALHRRDRGLLEAIAVEVIRLGRERRLDGTGKGGRLLGMCVRILVRAIGAAAALHREIAVAIMIALVLAKQAVPTRTARRLDAPPGAAGGR